MEPAPRDAASSGDAVNGPLRLSGEGCRFWVRGRCLYEELLNPGLMEAYACTVLRVLAERFDEFIVRGEIMGLSAEEAGRIWARRMDAALNIGWDCANFAFRPDSVDEMPCLHFQDGICVLCLPECPGRCRRFALPDR
jgi:hypothetical protein